VTIKGDAFKECTSVSDIIIPEGSALEHIYKGAFLMDTANKLKNVYVNANKYIKCDQQAFGMLNTDGQTVAGSVTTRLYYPADFYEEYVGSYKTEILGGAFESHEDKLANRSYAQGGSVTGVDGETYTNTKYPQGNGWWEFLSTGIPTPSLDWVVDANDYWRTYSDIVDLVVPEGFDENEPFSSDTERARAAKGINVYLVHDYDADNEQAILVRMKEGDVIPANTGVILHWRAEISDQAGAFFFLAPAAFEHAETIPYDNELNDNNLYKGIYRNYLKPLNTRGESVKVQNVEKKKGKAQYRNFFWGNTTEYAQGDAGKYKGNEFDQADAMVENWGFYRAVNGSYKVNNKAYLHLPASVYTNNNGAGMGEDHSTDTNANAFSFVIVGSEMTGISNVNVAEKNTDNSFYTLQGIKVSQPSERGIYIHNGKKIILK